MLVLGVRQDRIRCGCDRRRTGRFGQHQTIGQGNTTMAGRLQGKVALITGAGSVGAGWGNGRATAVLFAQEGALVFGVDKDPGSMEETAKVSI